MYRLSTMSSEKTQQDCSPTILPPPPPPPAQTAQGSLI